VDRSVLTGSHDSSCTPVQFEGWSQYSRLTFRFEGIHFSSTETLYSDPKCEISVLETRSSGRWEKTFDNVLSLFLSKMELRPLDPRIVESLNRPKKCGKSWEYGIAHEILDTPCGLGRRADYFAETSPSGRSFVLFECEGQGRIGPGCTRYNMAQSLPVSRLISRN
jgi:hypothetical protein